MLDSRVLLGKRIRSLRRAKDFSQEGLADKAGLSGKYLGEVERGQKNVSVDVVEKIAEALGLQTQELFDYEHEMDKKKIKQKINSLVNAADDKELQQILRTLKALLK